MAKRIRVKVTAGFERTLADLEAWLIEAGAADAFAAIIDALADSIIPNLERFPAMGRPFPSHAPGSVETVNATERLLASLRAIDPDATLREYLTNEHLLLYAHAGSTVYLLSIRHHRQVSFDLSALWGPG